MNPEQPQTPTPEPVLPEQPIQPADAPQPITQQPFQPQPLQPQPQLAPQLPQPRRKTKMIILAVVIPLVILFAATTVRVLSDKLANNTADASLLHTHHARVITVDEFLQQEDYSPKQVAYQETRGVTKAEAATLPKENIRIEEEKYRPGGVQQEVIDDGHCEIILPAREKVRCYLYDPDNGAVLKTQMLELLAKDGVVKKMGENDATEYRLVNAGGGLGISIGLDRPLQDVVTGDYYLYDLNNYYAFRFDAKLSAKPEVLYTSSANNKVSGFPSHDKRFKPDDNILECGTGGCGGTSSLKVVAGKFYIEVPDSPGFDKKLQGIYYYDAASLKWVRITPALDQDDDFRIDKTGCTIYYGVERVYYSLQACDSARS